RCAGGNPTWNLRIEPSPPPAEPLTKLGERRLGEERYALFGRSGGFRLDYSHAGCFDIGADGSAIVWYPQADASAELARAIVLGPVLSLALESSGYLCLHGSAVSFEGRVLAFLG